MQLFILFFAIFFTPFLYGEKKISDKDSLALLFQDINVLKVADVSFESLRFTKILANRKSLSEVDIINICYDQYDVNLPESEKLKISKLLKFENNLIFNNIKSGNTDNTKFIWKNNFGDKFVYDGKFLKKNNFKCIKKDRIDGLLLSIMKIVTNPKTLSNYFKLKNPINLKNKIYNLSMVPNSSLYSNIKELNIKLKKSNFIFIDKIVIIDSSYKDGIKKYGLCLRKFSYNIINSDKIQKIGNNTCK
jgi:hypothetical protein